eukprot:359911-Chlamydomonas_euryale.AAC.5
MRQTSPMLPTPPMRPTLPMRPCTHTNRAHLAPCAAATAPPVTRCSRRCEWSDAASGDGGTVPSCRLAAEPAARTGVASSLGMRSAVADGCREPSGVIGSPSPLLCRVLAANAAAAAGLYASSATRRPSHSASTPSSLVPGSSALTAL